MAIRGVQLQGRDVADYLLYADEKVIGVVFVKIRSITAKIRNDPSTKHGKTGGDHLIILPGEETPRRKFVAKRTCRRYASHAPALSRGQQ